MQYDEFIARLKRPKRKGDHQYDCQCPAHDDANQSLSVGLSDDGQRIMVFCQAKCSTLHVLQSLGLKMSDLFVDGKIPKRGKQPSRIVATYDYLNSDGELLYQKVRMDPKDFRQRKPDGNGGWSWSLNGTPRVLYRLPDLLASECEWVFVVEGEKDADNCHAIGLPATCNDGGAGKWDKVGDDSALHQRNVCIIADKDKPGRAHANDVARRLTGKAAVVKVVELPGGHVKDLSDWISAGGTADQLLQTAEAAPVFNPDSAPAPAPTSAPTDPKNIPLGQRDPEGRLVLSPRRSLPTAEAYVREFHTDSEFPTLRCYAGRMLAWRGNCYRDIEDASIRHRLGPWLDQAMRYVTSKKTGEPELVPFESNPGTVSVALDTIRAFTHVPSTTPMPSWLPERGDGIDARDVLPCRTMNLHIPTGRSMPATPSLFTGNALEFDYHSAAPSPAAWLAFLRGIWPTDQEQIDTLQDWFGYCLTADTSQQKMLLLVGPKRSGKGTIARILTRLIGVGNVVGPTVSSLAGPFGMQPLIGKSLAIVSDARFSGDGVQAVAERLLCISGEDTLTIDQKFQPSVSMKLPTRFAFLSNELPRLTDASGALAGRFIMLQMTETFYGREEVGLTDRLAAELPGILLWALAGWKRLHQRGHFVQPASVQEALEDMAEIASPVTAFVRDRCLLAADQWIWADELYTGYCNWCKSEGRLPASRAIFGRDLRSSHQGVVRKQASNGRYYAGICLREGER